jgi:hypothetical protein
MTNPRYEGKQHVENFRKRLRLAARQEFQTFWSMYRYWVTGAGIVGPVVVQIWNHGARSIRNLGESLFGAVVILVMSLLGTCVIALWKGAKQLDCDHLLSEKALTEQLSDLQLKLASPKVSLFEERQRSLVVEKLKSFSDGEQAVIRHLVHRGQVDRAGLAKVADLATVDQATTKGKDQGLVQQVGTSYNYVVNTYFHSALSFYFDGE